MNDRRPTAAAGECRRPGAQPEGLAPADSLVVLEDQERPLIWIGGEYLDQRAYEVGRFDGMAATPRWRRIVVAILAALVAGIFIGRLVVPVAAAAPRTAQTTERVDLSAPSSAGPSGAPPTADGHQLDGPRSVVGIASWVAPRYGSTYLALPDGPGHRVRICGRAACVTRTSTDAGPARFLQRQGRVADLSHADFARVCGCSPELVGLTHVTVFSVGATPTPPATDR